MKVPTAMRESPTSKPMASKLGFGDLPPYPSIVLGGIEVTPMQIAKAYAIWIPAGAGRGVFLTVAANVAA